MVSTALAAPAVEEAAHLQNTEGTGDLETAAAHLPLYGSLGYGDHGLGGYGGIGGYGGYGAGYGGHGLGYGRYGHGNSAAYANGYGNNYGNHAYTSLNKVVSHGSHGKAGGYSNGGHGAGSYGVALGY